MDSPRGVIWDGPSGTGPGTLYVMYPPKLTAFHDTDGDGKADKQEDLLTGLGFDLSFRGADHTTNGCRLGIDGYIYIAVGDYGFTKAVAKDGTTLSMRGGGIVRIRPDGTGFEIVSRGQRNIYDVAVSPTLELFTRDNTNDGGGWNVRLSHVPPGAHMGYPTLFKNFAEDIVQPLADYGGGSPCGALWLDEPGLQNGLYTVEWGSNGLMFHPLQQNGASWKAEQKKWLGITRPTDMDVDASGRIYITSWEGATFNYNGPHAGYVLRVTKKDKPEVKVPDFVKATPEELLKLVGSQSAVIRQTAQRELLRRIEANPLNLQGIRAGATLDLAEEKAKAGEMGAAYAAYWTFIQAGRGRVQGYSMKAENFEKLSPEWRLMEMRVLADPTLDAGGDKTLTAGLRDSDPRVRAAAVDAVRHRKRTSLAAEVLPLTADADPIVSHLAVAALRELKAAQPALTALDSADEKVQTGALRALYGIYEPAVVEGLIIRLRDAKGELRRGILNALCRLANQDEPYTDPKVWWGTRPDTSGPVYKPLRWSESEKIESALQKALDASSADDGRWLVQRLYLTKVNIPGLIDLMLTKAGSDTAAKLTAIEGMFRPDNALPKEACEVLKRVATDEKEVPEMRAKALRHLQRGSSNGSVFPFAADTFATFAGHDIGQPVIAAAFEDFTRDGKNTKWINDFSRESQGKDGAKRTLAQTVLVNLATSTLVKGKDKEKAEDAVAKAWEKPERAASLLGVIARTGAKAYSEQVKARLNDPNNAVAESALFAFQKLGLSDTGAPAQQIGVMKYEAVLAAVSKGGDAVKGKDIYLRAGCIACHTIGADEPPKGPILSAVAKMYDRAALTESILKPNAKLAQGFESTWIKTKKGEQIEGFITREGGDSVDIRNVAGQTLMVEKADIAERGHRDQSMMPEGLMNAFAPAELAHLLAYLESVKAK
ncbi:MAG: c-type cytochrome [Verrucomicrobiaceae bacterium]|nr:MAG: c-type cytochrome [Verrucomicrobiaceae bacterium]